MGGENYVPTGNRVIREGSSPRGRGKLMRDIEAWGDYGLIPAWAGKTNLGNNALFMPRAHPRVGGENSTAVSSAAVSRGSSPRGRGKPDRCSEGGSRCGLIPAWAGKTSVIACRFIVFPAHPRVGGENVPFQIVVTGQVGSSPRGRGKRRKTISCVACNRLIPAWAGKTSCPATRR